MAKMTLSGLTTFATEYVNAAKQAGAWSATHDNLYGVIDKIGKQITLDGSFQDKLPELDGDELPLGKTIEEYFIDLTLPVDYQGPATVSASDAAQGALKPYLPAVEDVSYSYTLGRKVIPTTIPYDNVERGCIDTGVAANMIGKITQKLTDSYSLYKYACKKQLLGNLAIKAAAAENAANLVETIPAITDTVSGESFIKKIKEDVETASFANEGHCLGNTLIGAPASSDLILIVKKGIMPTLEVDVEAGAFNSSKIALPVKIKVVDDFGDQDKVVAMLVDSRGIKFHRDYHAIRPQENGYSDYVNMFDHSENTGFISKYTYVKVYKIA